MNGRAHNLEVGRRLRDQGATDTLAADHAPHRSYAGLVRDSIEHYAAAGVPFTSEDVLDRITRLHPDALAHSPNVLPAAFRAASAANVIKFTGRITQSSRASRHASVIRIWQGAAA